MENFFPNSLEEWLVLLGLVATYTVGLVSAAWRLVVAPVIKRLDEDISDVREEANERCTRFKDENRAFVDGVGTRVNELYERTAFFNAKLEKQDRDMDKSQFDRASLHERMGKIEALIERQANDSKKDQEARSQGELGIRLALGKLETRVEDILREMKK